MVRDGVDGLADQPLPPVGSGQDGAQFTAMVLQVDSPWTDHADAGIIADQRHGPLGAGVGTLPFLDPHDEGFRILQGHCQGSAHVPHGHGVVAHGEERRCIIHADLPQNEPGGGEHGQRREVQGEHVHESQVDTGSPIAQVCCCGGLATAMKGTLH